MKRTIKLVGDRQREYAMQCVREAVLGQCVTIQDETRTQEQNRLMWPLIADIQAQVDGMATYSADDIKLRILHAYGQELRFLPELEGIGMFPVGQRSSTLTKKQFTGLIEFMFAYGARHNVRWSAKSQDVYNNQGTAGCLISARRKD
jgi:hypothetical protein